MAAKKVKTAIRKAQIISAAIDIIGQKGLKGLTIASIAKKVGIVDSNVYRHFKDKRDIIDAIIREISLFVEKIVKISSLYHKNPLKQLESIFFKHVSFVAEHKGIPRIFLSDEMFSSDKGLLNKLKFVMFKYTGEIRKILKRGIEENSFDKNIDVEAASMLFLGLMQSMAIQWLISDYSFSIRLRSREIWKIYLKGILTRSS